jgi:hypothetical protein
MPQQVIWRCRWCGRASAPRGSQRPCGCPSSLLLLLWTRPAGGCTN